MDPWMRSTQMDEMILSLPVWSFAYQPWELHSVSFGMPFECPIFGVKTLELLQTWNLLEPLGVMTLLMEQAVEHVTFLLISIFIGQGCHGPVNI